MLKIGSVQFVEDIGGPKFHRVNYIVKSSTGPSWDITVTMDEEGYEGVMAEVGSKLTPFSLWGDSISAINKMIFNVFDSQEEHMKGAYRDVVNHKITNTEKYNAIENDYRLMKQDVIAAMSKVFQIYEGSPKAPLMRQP